MCVVVVNNPGLIVLALQGLAQSHGDNNYLGIALAVEVVRPRACPPVAVASASLVGLVPGPAITHIWATLITMTTIYLKCQLFNGKSQIDFFGLMSIHCQLYS